MEFAQFDNLLDCIFIYNKDKQIVYCNEACATMLKTSLKRLKPGKLLQDFVQFEDENLSFDKDGTLGRDEEMMYREIPFTTKSNDKGTGLIHIRPIEINGEKNWMAIIRDMTMEIQLHTKHHQQLAALEDYSKNLEKMVEERTNELLKAHQSLDTMINSLGQGLLVFDKEFNCMPGYTKACEEIFGINPKDKKMWEILKLDEKGKATFIKWGQCIFSEMLPFNDMVGLGISHLSNDLHYNDEKFKYVALQYFPFKDQDDVMQGIVVVATDKTDEVRAKKTMEEKEAYVSMVTKIINNKKQFLSFVDDAKKIIAEMEKGAQSSQNVFDHPLLMRLMHSIKGGASLYSIRPIVELAHGYESELSPYKEKGDEERLQYWPKLQQNIQFLKKRLYDFFNVCRPFLGEIIEDGETRLEIKMKTLKEFYHRLQEHHSLASTFSDLFLQEPVIKYLTSYGNLVQDLAKKLGKSINPIQFNNRDFAIKTENFLEFFNVLVHLFRNCCDHGIEMPEVRQALGKNEKGTIAINLQRLGQQFMMIITDDGSGIDPAKIRNKLIKSGKQALVDKESDQEIIYHIFDSSFSTKEEVTEVSGRGVGMDAISEVVKKIGGTIELKTELNKGTSFIFQFPWPG